MANDAVQLCNGNTCVQLCNGNACVQLCTREAPCECPDGLASSYVVTVNGVPVTVSVTGSPCFWNHIGVVDLGNGYTLNYVALSLNTLLCVWEVTFNGLPVCDGVWSETVSKATGSSPVGDYGVSAVCEYTVSVA